MIGRFPLKSATRIEKTIRFSDAQAYERAASKRMAAIGGEMGERELMAPREEAWGRFWQFGQVLAAT